MKVVILGAGITGLTTAYFLLKQGCDVTVIDQQQPGLGASYANGGQLSYAYSTPIATPQVLKQLPKILFGLDPAFKIYPTLDWGFYSWGLRYLIQCLPSQSRRSAAIMQQLGQLSKQRLQALIADTDIEFHYREGAGKLYVYRQSATMPKLEAGSSFVSLSGEETLSRVPALSVPLAGGLFESDEDAGDCYQFCLSLSEYLRQQKSVTFLTQHKILGAETADKKIQAIKTDKGNIAGDNFICALGTQSAAFSRSLGLKLPIYPMKGYSVTVPATDLCPQISVTDTANKVVYCKLGDRLRIAGFAEFSGYDTTVKPKRIKTLLSNARELLPGAGDYDRVLDAWYGLRPATPDGLPIVGKTPYDNLLLNTGHGMLGWTYGAGTADLVVRLLFDQAHGFDSAELSLGRFKPCQ